MQRNNMLKMILAATVFIAAGANAQTTSRQVIHEFTLADALDYGKKNSVEVKNALLDIKIQQQENRDITSLTLPQVNITGSATHNFDIAVQTIPNFIGPATYQVLVDEGVKNGAGSAVTIPNGGNFGNIQLPFGSPWNANAGVTLSQVLFDGQVLVALKARKGTVKLQEKVAELTEQNIRANIYKVYYQLVAGKVETQLLDANIERLEKLSHDLTIMYNNGFIEKLDIDKVTVQIANLQTEKRSANTSITNGYSGLKVLMGMPFKDSLVLKDTLNDSEVKEGVLEASQFNYTDRPDYQVSQITNDLNELNVRRYKLSQLPTLALTGGYSKQAQREKFDFFGNGDWFTSSYAGIQLKIPIFNGFSLQSKTEKARLELQKSRNNTEALKILIDEEVDNAKNNFIVAISTMDNQKKNMALAERVYEQTKKKYEIGTGSTTEINTAQVDLKTAQTNYLSALYDAIIAKVDFLKATGKL